MVLIMGEADQYGKLSSIETGIPTAYLAAPAIV